MRVFIYQLDGYVGSTLAKRCAEEVEDCEVIGTHTAEKYRKPKHVQRLVSEGDLSAMKEALLSSDVIIYELDGKSKEVTSALKVLLRHDYDDEKVLIGISTLMSWAKSGPPAPEEGEEGGGGGEDDEEMGLTWENFAERKPHPNYKANVTSENVILTKGNVKKPSLRTYVIWPGVLYGNGENVFHSLFKCAWHCSESLPVIGDGENIIPTIHVHDLAGVIMAVMQNRPDECQGFVAVDNSKNSLKNIVKAISVALSNGNVSTKTHDEYLEFMTEQDEAHANFLMLQLSLKMDFSNKEELGVEWRAEGGLVEHMAAVTEEFREYRTLQPVRTMMYGPPLSGKTFYSKELKDEYELPLLQSGPLIAWAREAGDQLAADIKKEFDGPAEEDLPKKKGGKKADDGPPPPIRLSDETMAKIYRKRMWLPDCRNQGWVLDGFPKTQKQAQLLFECSAEEAEEPEDPVEEEEAAEPEEGEEIPSWEKKVKLPEVFVTFDATDDLLKQRAMQMPEEEKEGTHNTEEHFTRRLATFRANDVPETSPLGVLEDNKVRVLHLASQENTEHALDLLRLSMGAPRNYHPNRTRELRERRDAEEKEARELAEKEAKEVAEAEERELKTKIASEERERLKELAMQERAALDTRSLPLRQYLMDNVLPILTKGLLEVSKVRPSDPVDFLAEFLFKQDPEAA